MLLKLSRSMNSAATGVWLRRERASICSTRSRISVRLGRPVSGSWVARNASSSSRRVSSSSVRWRSVSKHSHIRSRLNSRLSCRMFSASGERLGRSTPAARRSRAAPRPSTLRHQRQRLVTSFSDAARWAASSPKICQVSWPASRATSMPSPAIHRATAIVELRLIRSKLSCTTRVDVVALLPRCARRSARAPPRCAPSASRRDDRAPHQTARRQRRGARPQRSAAAALAARPFQNLRPSADISAHHRRGEPNLYSRTRKTPPERGFSLASRQAGFCREQPSI